MAIEETKCCRSVGAKKSIIKYGKTKSGNQRYYCKVCHKTKVEHYCYKAYYPEINENIVLLTKEGLGIRSLSRVLKISTTTLLKRILIIAKNISPPVISFGKAFQVDEMRTFIKRKDRLYWIVYALQDDTRKVVQFSVGRRTYKTLNRVIDSLKLSNPIRITTDKLTHYTYLIEKGIHNTKKRGTNYIERHNLTLRTHLKRLNRKTICFSKQVALLQAVLKIYFWG